MPVLVIHMPDNQVIENDKKSFDDAFADGIGYGFALNKKILAQVFPVEPGYRVVMLCKSRQRRAEGDLVRLEPAFKHKGVEWWTDNHIRRYHVHMKNLKIVEYKSEKLNKNGVAVI
jgi:hypothetical protein